MRLEIFNFIDETIEYLESRKEFVDSISSELEQFFFQEFNGFDYFLNVTKRVKSYSSLKEKIIRNNLFLEYKTPDMLFENLPDLIGLRIECRFIEDEKKAYNDLVKLFNINCGDGYFTNNENPNIKILLGETQPQIQKNGFEIYKFDGKYIYSNKSVNFELQIKSLVNEFWGEIDHRVLYKNFNYMLTEDFFHDIMVSIKDNLSMIDRQLMIVYEHLRGSNVLKGNHKVDQVKSLVSKIVHDHYITKIKDEIGFVMDFKKLIDTIVDYLFQKDCVNCDDGGYGDYFVWLLNRLNFVLDSGMNLTTYLIFEEEIYYPDEFTKSIGENILEVINLDFKWNLFFKIVLEIEEGNDSEDFSNYLIFVKDMIIDVFNEMFEDIGIDTDLSNTIIEQILNGIAEGFSRDRKVEYLTRKNIEFLSKKVKLMIIGIQDEFDWHESSGEVLSMVRHFTYH